MRIFNRASVKVATAPTNEPVDLTLVKEYLKIDESNTSEDATLLLYISAARQFAESYLRRKLMTQTLELWLDFAPNDDYQSRFRSETNYYENLNRGREIELPYAPIQSITSFKYYTQNNTETTYSSSNYFLDGEGARLVLNQGQNFPTDLRVRASIKITYVAGYGDNDENVPAAIRQSILEHIYKMYECKITGCDAPDVCKQTYDAYKQIDMMGF